MKWAPIHLLVIFVLCLPGQLQAAATQETERQVCTPESEWQAVQSVLDYFLGEEPSPQLAIIAQHYRKLNRENLPASLQDKLQRLYLRYGLREVFPPELQEEVCEWWRNQDVTFLHDWWECEETLDTTKGGHISYIKCVCFSPDGRILVSSSYDASIKLWMVVNGEWQCVATLDENCNGHSNHVMCVQFSPDGSLLVSAGYDGTLKVWAQAGESWQCVETFDGSTGGHRSIIWSLAFNTAGGLCASGSNDGTIKMWSHVDGRWVCIATLIANDGGPNQAVNSVAFSSDDNLLVSGLGSGTIVLRSCRENVFQTIFSLEAVDRGHRSSVYSIAFNPIDSTLFASAGNDCTVKLWSYSHDSWQCIESLNMINEKPMHTSFSIVFSPDGSLLASASNDKNIYLWYCSDGTLRCIDTLGGETAGGHIGRVDTVAFSPDGNLLASGSGDCTIKLWSPPLNHLTLSQVLFVFLINHSDNRERCLEEISEETGISVDDIQVMISTFDQED